MIHGARSGEARTIRPLLLSVILLLVLAGCRTTQPIGRLLDDPARYDGHTVRIDGRVVRSAGALGLGAYQVDDGTGLLTVVSEDGGAPRAGARVRVTGWFRSFLTVGDLSVAGMLERDRDRP